MKSSVNHVRRFTRGAYLTNLAVIASQFHFQREAVAAFVPFSTLPRSNLQSPMSTCGYRSPSNLCHSDFATRCIREPTLTPSTFKKHPLRARSDNESDESKDQSLSAESAGWLATIVLPLWFVYITNQWNRYSINYLVDFSNDAIPFQAMNVDIGFDQAQYGLLASIAFTALYAVATLGAGIASDRFNRRTLTIAAALGWSAATLGTALANTYTEVLLCRVAMGLACAFSTPTAYTLIKERVPEERIALATSVYGTGVAVASGLASLSLILDTQVGWRSTLLVVSAIGFASAVATVALVEDDDPKKRTGQEFASDGTSVATDGSVLADVQEAVSTSRVQWIFLGSFLRFCSGLCIGVWGAPYFRMVFSDQQSEYAIAQAGISAIGASLSGLLGGATADWLSSNAAKDQADDPVGRRLWVPVVGSILAAPAWYYAVNSEQSFETAMAFLAAEYFVAECWFGPTISTLQSTVGPRIGGTAQGLFTLTGAFANLAPSLLGFLYGSMSGGGQSSPELANLLAAGVCIGYLSSAFCFAVAAKSPPPVAALPDKIENNVGSS